jgi:hypothetical protein
VRALGGVVGYVQLVSQPAERRRLRHGIIRQRASLTGPDRVLGMSAILNPRP